MKLRIGYLLSGITTGFIVLLSFIWTQPDGKLHIVFCNVGQGDAIYMRFVDGKDMLIDGGPNDRVLSCLGRHMPFWDRTLDIVALSHPQKDHMAGLLSVFNRYSVGYFVRSQVDTSSEDFRKLMDFVREKNITQKYMSAGDTMIISGTSLSVVWPSSEQMALTRPPPDGSPLRQGYEGQADVLGTSVQLNDFSLVLALTYGTFDALFPGDADSHVEAKFDRLQAFDSPVEILKVPHHGSKTGMTEAFVNWIKPQIAVISVGNNTYGHPTNEAIGLLKEAGSQVLRTDQMGDIEIVSDGHEWYVKR
jgi:competence protein ComEC